jgi:hypothetical protein
LNSNELDPELLKKMMMGGYSSSFSNKDKKYSRESGRIRKKEIDLHFNKLYPQKSGLSSAEKLQLQLDCLEEQLAENRGKVRQLIVVVGKGEGVLKKEVLQKLKRLNLKNSLVEDPPYFGNAIRIYL